MRLIFHILFFSLILSSELIAQDNWGFNHDSIYFLNVTKVLKLEVIEKFNPTLALPFVNMDFPYSTFDSAKKIIKVYRDKSIKISDSIIALIRIETYADKTYGNGGCGDIILFSGQLSDVDSNLSVDSISASGIF